MPLRLLLLVALAVGACRKHDAERVIARPLLWKVERDGHTTVRFGPMHQGTDPPTQPPPGGAPAPDGARAFAMETDLTQAARYPVMRADGSWLHDELGPGYWHKLERALGASEAHRIDGMKPMIAATLLALRGLPQRPAMDAVLLARARQQGKPIVYLETIEDELGVLERWYDARAVREMLDDLHGVEARSQEMLAAYLAGDADAVLEITLRDEARDGALEDLLYRRNASWIDGIERVHADGGGFIAVGAAHLVGPRGVVALLEQRGYRVPRLM